MTTHLVNNETLLELLDELDTRASQQHAGISTDKSWVCHRRHPRYPFRAECVVRFFSQGTVTVTIDKLTGRTRNLSRGGIGLVVRRVFNVGEPIEVEVDMPDRGRVFMAGLVGFCRYAGLGHHEVGVSLKTAGPEPTFSDNPMEALQSIEWLCCAIEKT